MWILVWDHLSAMLNWIVSVSLNHVWLFCNPLHPSPPGSSGHRIFQARILEWVAISFSRGFSWPRDQSLISCIGRRSFTTEPPRKPILVSQFSSVHFSHSVVSDSLRPHESQHARPPCPSQAPRVYWNSCPSSRWCHPAISSSIGPFSSCPQSLQASGSFPMSQLFTWGGQSTGVSASASVLPMNTQDLSPWSLGSSKWHP